jgi:hypothetical protein
MTMTLIRKLPEPKRLLLAWQSPKPGSSRRRWDVGELVRNTTDNGAPVALRYFDGERLAGAFSEGFDGYPAFGLRDRPIDDVLETLMRRLPPRRRSDFPRYLNSIGISEDAQFTDFALLGASEAKLPSDGFSVVNPFDDREERVEFISEVAGYRHLPERVAPNPGDQLDFAFDRNNPHDANAIQVLVGSEPVGWVNRLQTPAFREWITDRNIEALIWRVNGSSECPRLYMRVRAGPE